MAVVPIAVFHEAIKFLAPNRKCILGTLEGVGVILGHIIEKCMFGGGGRQVY